MKRIFGIFKIKKEERWLALAALLYAVLLNAIVIWKYYDKFSVVSDNYHKLFVRTFRISGFDPLTYEVVSNWTTSYNIYRHPLLAFFMYIPNQINQGLMMLTGMNFVQFVVAAILVFCAFYSFIFLYRIFREVIELKRFDSVLLTALNFSFAYVMVSVCVPDHFSLSMFLLIMTLYVSGKKMKNNKPFTVWQTVLLFVLTAGISLNNGIKVFLANLFVNGRKFWRPKNLILAIIVPSALIWIGARMEWNHFEKPKYVARQELKKKKADKAREKVIQQYNDTATAKDSSVMKAQLANVLKHNAKDKNKRDKWKAMIAHTGKPMGKGEFTQWTDISTSRWQTLAENWFGESLQLHQDYLLGDTLRQRPVIVHYRLPFNYVVETIVVLLFAGGIWCGRRQRFLWLTMSFLGFDVLIHIILGFGINEVYIMSAHWLFTFPIAIAYLSCNLKGRVLVFERIAVIMTALFLYIWNLSLFGSYLLG